MTKNEDFLKEMKEQFDPDSELVIVSHKNLSYRP